MTRKLLSKSLYASLVSCVLVASASESQARPWRPAQLPNGMTFRCSNCHISEFGAGPRTPFGESVNEIIQKNGDLMFFFWSPELAGIDSDGDGRTNGEELGDPLGLWLEGDADPDVPEVTNPGVEDDFGGGDGPQFVRSDANNDGRIDIGDGVFLFNFLFAGAEPPACGDAGDTNDDGNTDISDGVFVLNFLFSGGDAPPGPFPDCGEDTTEDGIDCAAYDHCAEV